MKSKLFNNLGLKLLALIAAIVIWIIVVSINDPVADKVYRDIPVTILNEKLVTKEGKTFQIEDGAGTVNVTVRAQRSILSRLRAQNIEVTADLKEMTMSNLVPISVMIRGYEGRYQKATPNPLNIELSIEDIVTNKFPITVQPTGSLRDGFALAKTTVEPETVTISGPQSIIRSIDQATAPAVLTGISGDKDVKSELVLYDATGEEIDQSRLTDNIGKKGVIVHVKINPTGSVPIRIDEEAIETPEGTYLADVSYEPTSVTVAADEDVLDSLEEIVIPADAFDLSEAREEEEVTLKISKYLPDDVQLASEEEVKVVVTFRVAKYGEKTFKVPTGAILVDNLRDRFDLTYASDSDLEIRVKGPQSVLNDLDLSKAVSIDLKECDKEGTYTVPVSVELPDKCEASPVKVKIKLDKSEH